MTVGRKRLVDHLAALDAARFVGRGEILAHVEGLLAGSDPKRVMLLHGPGGIGKSALVREIGRRAQALGRQLNAIDARALEPVPGELETALETATDAPGVVVTIDAFEHVRALDSLLRERILPSLPADSLVVVASRDRPGPNWFTAGWEHVVWDIPLGPLRVDEALDFLTVRGVTDPDIAAALVEWAGGSPLALSLAVSGTPGDPLELDGGDLHRVIVRRLAGDELDGVDNEVLEVAALARAVDSRLLTAVLPGRPTRAANQVLRGCSVAERVGGRVTLHDLVRSSLRDDLRRRNLPRYDRLRRAIADHLLARATAGEVRLLSDLLELIDDPQVRWGIGGHAHARFRIDPWRPEDTDTLRDLMLHERNGDRRWWDPLERLLDEAPEMGLVTRDLDGEPVACSVATPVTGAPPVAEQDAVLAPILADARTHARKEHAAGASSAPGRDRMATSPSQAMIFRDGWRKRGPTGEAALGVVNLAAVLRSGLPNVSRSYILDTVPGTEEVQAFFQAVGAVRQPHLDPRIADRDVPCWVVDHGPDGMLGQIRDVIYAEASASGEAATGSVAPRDGDLQRAAFDALRDFTRPEQAAENLLIHYANGAAQVSGGPQRAERLREEVVRAVEAAFGRSPSERLLHDIVKLGDLDPTVTHEQAMLQLSVSRATYFRQLRKARERVASVLLEQLSAVD